MSVNGFDPDHFYGPEPEPGSVVLDPDLEALADLMAERMELAVVQRVPRELLQLLDDNSSCHVELHYGVTRPNLLVLKYVRRGDVLEFEFWVNACSRVATFRFQATP
jgi:hypothetical protein